jgi:hypothetical protein
MYLITFYKIFQIDKPENFYIGSTSSFSKRKARHKKNVYNRVGRLYRTLLYSNIRENGGWDKFTMIKLYESEFENLYLARLEEQCIINLLMPTLNKIKSSLEIIEEKVIENIKIKLA